MEHPHETGKKASDAKSVSKTLAILSTFDERTPMQRTSDIAARLGMNISTVSRHLNTLLDWGFLRRDDETGCYYPGTQIISLAGAALQDSDVYRYSFPELQLLSFRYGVHSHMSVQDDTEIMHLISCCCEHTMDLFVPMGHRQPMYCSAMGRIMLAYMPEAKAEDILKRSNREKRTPDTKVGVDEIMQELKKERQQGICLLVNELAYGKGSIAAPILDRDRNPVAAISVSTSANALSQPQREAELKKRLRSLRPEYPADWVTTHIDRLELYYERTCNTAAAPFCGQQPYFFNDMPEMVAERFRKDGYDCEVAMIAHGGWSLSRLVEEPEVQFNIRYGHYDYVMLQDMSNPFESERRFIGSIAILVQWIRETGARPILYLPWTRCDGEDRQAAMTASYKKASAEYKVPLAPAGEFWWEYRREHPEIEMYYEDGTHASEAGSEFAAGYIYRAILADMKQNME